MGVHHQQVQALLALFAVDGGDEHTAGVDAHHGAGGQVGDGDAGLAHELLRLVIGVDAAEDGPGGAGAVVQGELQQLLGLLHGLAGQDLHGPEVGLGEGLKVHKVGKQGLDLHLGEVDFLLRLGGGGSGGLVLLLGDVQGLHGGE